MRRRSATHLSPASAKVLIDQAFSDFGEAVLRLLESADLDCIDTGDLWDLAEHYGLVEDDE